LGGRRGEHHEDASSGQAESPVALKMTAHHVPLEEVYSL
jgi:hypothetical protein